MRDDADLAPGSPLTSGTIRIAVGPDEAGLRLDHLLVHHLPETSRNRIISSIRSGSFLVDGKCRKNSYKLKTGETVSGALEEEVPLDVVPEKIDFPILFEDEHLLVLIKPPGLVVHPGSGNPSGTLVNGLLFHCRQIGEVGDADRPGIVHRLDKDTSGVMVCAKQSDTLRALVNMFKGREVKKEYFTLVHGLFREYEGRIVAPIGRHSVNRQKMAVREGAGKYAASNYVVIDELDNRYSLVKVRIETGRTHQIRVHMAHIGHPVAGDRLYGPGRDNKMFPRQMLHAARLVFTHPVTGVNMRFDAPLWQDMATVIAGMDSAAEQYPEYE